MTCKKGGLVLLRHKDVVAEWHHLCAHALSPAAVSDERLIHSGWGGNAGTAPPGAEPPPELRGHIGVHGFWRRRAAAILATKDVSSWDIYASFLVEVSV
jgi:hypothetical protein